MGAMASQITSLAIVYSTFYPRRKSKKTSKLRLTGLYEGNSPVTGEFPAQRVSNAENVSIWWRRHGEILFHGTFKGFHVSQVMIKLFLPELPLGVVLIKIVWNWLKLWEMDVFILVILV